MYDTNNIFAKIINGEISSKLIFEDDQIIAFHDMYPVAPVHVLVMPKGQYKDYTHFITTASSTTQLHLFKQVAVIANDLCGENFRLCTNNGALSGQTVFHFHVHILGGKQLGGL